MKKFIILSILTTIVFFSLKYLVNVSAIATISCPTTTCFVGNCQCSISGCLDGLVYIYDTNSADCSGSAISKPSFQGSSFNWSPEEAKKYYLVVRCTNQDISTCTEITVSLASTTTSTTVGSTTTFLTSTTSVSSSTTTTTTRPSTSTIISTTTTTTAGGCSYDNPCPADCGKRKLNQATNNQDYYEFVLDSVSNVTIRLDSSSNVDYDLYVNWNENKPDESEYDCPKPHKGMGEREECKNAGLSEGTYYIMVKLYEGSGMYNLSITCTPISCSDQNHPCKIDCGKTKSDRSTNTEDYYTFKLTSKSNVTVKLYPTSNVDYELYVKWDKTKPTIDKYDCKPQFGKGENEVCKIPDPDQGFLNPLEPGDYYIMVDWYEGIGTYDLSLSCLVLQAATTTTIAASTTTSVYTSTTIRSNTSTTIRSTTTTAKTSSSCGPNGYCESTDTDCKSGYEDCPGNDVDCGVDEKCCCVAEIHPEPSNLGLIVGLIVVLLMVILVYFFIKGRSRVTFEKLYRKWTR